MSHARPEPTLRRRGLPSTPDALPAELHPVLRRVYRARGITAPEELELSLGRLPPADEVKGMDAAVGLLTAALEQDRRILVVADFDADGATSCAVLVRGLRAMGAGAVDYLVPNRFEFGYGLSPEIVRVAAERGPDLLVTVDNGISSVSGVALARELGMQVLVTDHHLPGEVLPGADAIINPNQPGCPFPAKDLAGVGVVFYLLGALRARLRADGWFARRGLEEPNLASLLDLVALGTVADVVPLGPVNRILVEQGLRRIRAGECCPGVLALFEAARREPRFAVASDLGFGIGPRLNAAGRLTEMSLGIDCLLSESAADARRMAAELDQLNRERRDIEREMQRQALEILRGLPSDEGRQLPHGVVLFDKGWHQGVIGILASRIKDRLHRPVIAFAPIDETTLKGSARSVAGLHIRDALDAVAARHPGLVEKFGGHAMAAGLSLARPDLERFRRAFDEEVRRHLRAEDLAGVVLSDGELDPSDLELEFAELLRNSGPWGSGFAEPLFDGSFQVIDKRIVGERHLKLVLDPGGARGHVEAIHFNSDALRSLRAGDRVNAAYRLDVNRYRGRRTLQLMIEWLRVLH